MRDPIAEDILHEVSKKMYAYERKPNTPIVPAARRYPHSLKRVELEYSRQPWAQRQAHYNTWRAS